MFYDRQTLAEEIKKLIKDKKRRKDFLEDPKKLLDCYGIVLDPNDKKCVFGKSDYQKSFQSGGFRP